MNEPQVKLYKFDVTGKDPNNLVDGEPHVVTAGKKDKMIVPYHGPFYAASVKLYKTDGTLLKKGTDYQTCYLYPELSARTGKAVTSFIRILNTDLEGDVRLTYQVVGDGTITGSQAFLDILLAIQNDERPVNWDNIFNKPATFPPSPHQHDIAYETYNWGGLVDVFRTWAGAMQRRTLVGTDDLYARLDNVDTVLRKMVADTRAYMEAHIHNYENPHYDTKDTIGLGLVDNYATATLDDAIQGTRSDLLMTPASSVALINSRVGGSDSNFVHQGHLRISQYGTLNYLPAGVAGSYEGAGGYIGSIAWRTALIEADASLIGLRMGNNGIDQGLYYFHLPSAKKVSTGVPIRTNYLYNPAAFAGDRPIYQSRADAWSALFVQTKSGAYHAVLTNRTMDQTKHDVAKISNIADVNLFEGFRSTFVKVIGSRWYLFKLLNVTIAQPLAFEIWYVDTSAIKANATVALTKMTGIKSTGLYGTVTADYIQIAPKWGSNVAADNPAILYTGDYLNTSLPHSHREFMVAENDNDSNMAMVVLSFNSWFTSIGGGGALFNEYAYSMELNLSAKTATIKNNPGRTEFTFKATETPVIARQGAILPGNGVELFGVANTTNKHTSTFMARDGFVATIIQDNQTDNAVQFATGQITNFTNLYDSLANVKTRRFLANVPLTTDKNVFGSNVGNTIARPVFFSKNEMFIVNTNNRGELQPVMVGLDGGYKDYTYNVLNVGSTKGFKPTSKRYVANWTRNFLSLYETSAAGAVRVDGSVMTNYGRVAEIGNTAQQAPVTLTAKLVDGVYQMTQAGQITWDAAELEQVSKTAMAGVGMPNIASILVNVYVPQNTDLPIIAIAVAASAINATTRVFTYGTVVFELNYTGARGNGTKITGYSAGKTLWSYKDENAQNNGTITPVNDYSQPMSVWKTAAGDYLIGAGMQIAYGTQGNRSSRRWRFAVPAGTKTVDVSTVVSTVNYPYISGENRDLVAIPAVGIAEVDFDNNTKSYFSNLLVSIKGTTLADFKAWTTKETVNLVSQQVEQGMLVYFTEETRCFMAGAEWTLPVGSIDLRTLVSDPTNKTFYLYVMLDQTGAYYSISQTEILESLSVMQIGVIKTDSTQIVTIDVEKPTLIDGYRVSTKRRGSAIPVSTGSVNGPGGFAWTS